MKISWKWLNTFVRLSDMSPENLSNQLTMAGCEIEEISEIVISGKKDYILDITSTPNRSDLQGMIGIAKEVCAILNLNQDTLSEVIKETNTARNSIAIVNHKNNSSQIPINYCSISNLTTKSTPTDIRDRLEASGIEIQDNINDIGNYVMLKWGHPVEIIDIKDMSPIKEGNIVFEKEKNKNTEEIIVTKYHDHTVALTGINTKEKYKVTQTSSNVCLQTSLVPIHIVRRNSKISNIRNEFSMRYERGLDIENLQLALMDAILLIKKIYPEALVGSIYNNIMEKASLQKTHIKLHANKVKKLLGKIETNKKMEHISSSQIEQILLSLGCSIVKSGSEFDVEVPTSRKNDLCREIDLIEEIARIQGFNSFKDSLPTFGKPRINSRRNLIIRDFEKKIRSLGMTEVIHYSLTAPNQNHAVQLENPLMTEYSYLRTNLLNNLIKSFNNNVKTESSNCEVFEIGRIFSQHKDGGIPTEKEMIAGVFGGRLIRNSWQLPTRQIDWFEAKGVIEMLLLNLGDNTIWERKVNKEYRDLLHPNRCASIYLDDQYIGTFGEIHPQITKQENILHNTYCFEIELAKIIQRLELKKEVPYEFKNYSSFPSIIRDVSIITSVNTTIASILKTINQENYHILKKVKLFDEYKGNNIEKGKRSVGFRLIYQSNSKTLTTEEVDDIHEKLKNKLKEELKAEFK